MGKCLEVAVVGEKSTIILQVINFNGEPCKEPIKSLQCNLMSEITGVITNCSVKKIGQNQYESSFQPTIKGRHQLHYRVEGQHIRGSPFVVHVTIKSPLENLGNPILTMCDLKGPSGVAINQKGEVVVTEKNRHCVSVLSPDGKECRWFGTRGSVQGQFQSPQGVAIDGEGNILISDKCNHRIQKLTSECHFLTSVGTEGGGPLQFSSPCGISCNTYNNKVYVVDGNNYRVQVLNSDLTFSSTFGESGVGKGQFDSPSGIACDSTGTVYVADTDNKRIQVFTAGGEFLRLVDGTDRGEMGWPCGVAVDTSGMMYVTNFSSKHVSVFNSEGQIVTSFDISF